MSYILEALKKAQAERQLGSAPTIHAPVVQLQAASSANRKPLVIGFTTGALLVAGALLAWRQQGPATPAQTVAATQQARTESQAAPGQGTVQAGGVADGVPAPAQRNMSAPAPQAPAPRARVALVPDETTHAPAVVSKPAPISAPAQATIGAATQAAPAERAGVPAQGGAQPQAIASRQPAPAAAPAVVPVSAQPAVPTQTNSAAGSDATLPTLNALPDGVRGSVPKIAFGGYMYSANPADRLILVDNILRHEGEEVAPGLMLEKLLPKGAVMNFRGYRYRVAF